MRPPDTSPIGFSTVNSSNFGARSPQRRISHISAASGDSPTDARQISSPSPSLLSTGGGGVLARSSSLPGMKAFDYLYNSSSLGRQLAAGFSEKDGGASGDSPTDARRFQRVVVTAF